MLPPGLVVLTAMALVLPAQASPVEQLTLSGALAVGAVGKAGQTTRLEVSWHDGNAADHVVEIRFGDGQGTGSAQFAECVTPLGFGEQGQSFEVEHRYARRGTYTATLTVSTRECWTSATGLGKESIERRVAVTVR